MFRTKSLRLPRALPGCSQYCLPYHCRADEQPPRLHSLHGWSQFGRVIPAIYTYGESCVGNPTFSTYVDSLKAVNQNDIVPHLAPEAFGIDMNIFAC
ncbi:hypothetical protein BC936DRAFT_146352 [Jimgerdemannia flammicorona]|uniref:Fungal lipase-type domain-containing protein n=1 Tax=Jimgerdemannia flammicorona TaxID=994334 RepID=A0A433D7V7_9FUNG|nr:hypothetical protein BC936DRAFT_146352 [Jimgerdemannia flammicorona]